MSKGLKIMNDVGKMLSDKSSPAPASKEDDASDVVEAKDDPSAAHDAEMAALHAKIADLHGKLALHKSKPGIK